MKKEKYIYRVFVLCIIVCLLLPIQSMAKVDPMGIYLDERGNTRYKNISGLDWSFLNIKIEIMMTYPDEYLGITISYDQFGYEGDSMKDYIELNTEGKIVINIRDTRKYFSSSKTKDEVFKYLNGYRVFLASRFYGYGITYDFDNDVVIYVIPKEGLQEGGLVGYFYKGEFVILKDLP